MPEWPRHHFEKIAEGDLLRLDGDRSGLDLRQVQDIADEIEKVGARTMDRLCEFNLLGRQVSVGVFPELLPEDQDRIEWRP